MTEAEVIIRPSELADLVEDLHRQPVIAVDTESNGLHAYQEQVCLVQFSTPERDYLVDPLQLPDLSALGPVFSDPGVKKIFHAADYDLLCLRRDFGFEFANLFDTMHAARVLGRTHVGLGNLLEQAFGIQLDKRYQRADWGQRPLPPAQIAYAQLDTHYLIPLYNMLQEELTTRGRVELAEEDFQRMCRIGPESSTENNGTRSLVSGAHDLSPQEYPILLELCAYRDQVARRLNRPLFKVFSDNVLIAITQTRPQHTDELKGLPGMTPKVISWHGAAIIQAVRRGMQAEPVRPPRSPRPNEAYLNRIERLRTWRKEVGQAMQVDSDVILPKDLMRRIAENNPREIEELTALMQDSPWRARRYGSEIMTILNARQSNSQRRKS